MKLGAESNKIILNVSGMDVVVLSVTKYAFAFVLREINYYIGAPLSNFSMQINVIKSS